MSRVILAALLAVHLINTGEVKANVKNLAGGHMTSLVPRDGDHCTRNKDWCVSLMIDSDDKPPVPVVRTGGTANLVPHLQPDDLSSDESYAVWPNLIVLKDGSFLAGVETRTSTGYSGGGGSATELRLFQVAANGEADAKPVLEAPLHSLLTIRACFSERDMRRRRGACQDEYSFSAHLELAAGIIADRPVLAYTAEAWKFPRGASRFGDSTQMQPLKQGDLVRQREASCSFTRLFRFDALERAYQPDKPLPDCSDYTVP